MTTTDEMIAAYNESLEQNDFVEASRNGSHSTDSVNPKDMAELIRAMGENGLITKATKRVVGTRMRQ